MRVRIETLSDAANIFTASFGLTDLSVIPNTSNGGTIAAGDPANGVYFSYTHGTNSGKWIAVTRDSSNADIKNSTVTVTPNQWYKLKVVANSTGTQIDYYIDDVLIGSCTDVNKIPRANPLKFVFKIEKGGGTVGNVARTCSIDYVGWKVDR